MLFYTADTHFSHSNIIRYCQRPFKSTAEMDDQIITNWNTMIQKTDTVYHLGDFAFCSPGRFEELMKRLNHRELHLIKGNHDKSALRQQVKGYFASIQDVLFQTIQHKGKKYEIFLSHYAHRSWPKSFHGSWHLFGHSHGKLGPQGLSFDVGVDANNFWPWSLENVIQRMSSLVAERDLDPDDL